MLGCGTRSIGSRTADTGKEDIKYKKCRFYAAFFQFSAVSGAPAEEPVSEAFCRLSCSR